MQRVRNDREAVRGREVVEPRYWPVLDLATGRVVGAELVAPAVERGRGASGPATSDTSDTMADSIPILARAAAGAFASGPAAAEGWWVAIRLRFGQVASTSAADVVFSLLRDSRLDPDRLVLQITEAEFAHAVSSGSVAALASLGVRFGIIDFGAGDVSLLALRAAPIAFAQVNLTGLDGSEPADVSALRSVLAIAASLGIHVLGQMVEFDGQLALAGDVGIELVQGYRWGSAGSLPKLLSTWTRQAISG